MTRQELQLLRSAPYRIQAIDDRIDAIRATLENVTGGYAETVQSSSSDKMAEYVAQLVDWQAEQLAVRTDLVALRRRASAEFAELPYPLNAIMDARYINLEKWEAVAEQVHYSLQHCFTLHAKYVKSLKQEIK